MLTRATSHEPSDRPQDAGAFRALLQKAAAVDAEAAAQSVTTPGGPMWILAVDLGSSTTVAAARGEGQAAAIVDVDGQTRMPSVVFADAGAIITGEAAEQLGRGRPSQMLRAVKARIGDPVAPVLGGRVYPVVDLVAELLRRVYDEAVAQRGGPPREVRITHPANWNRPRVAQLVSAAVAAGLVNPIPVPEPIAAAAGTGHHDAAETGSLVAVYDLGGGTFDAAVLEVTSTGYEVTGRPVGDSSIGGDLFDDLVMNALGEQLEPSTWQRLQAPDDAEWATSAALCRTEARRVKEALSQHTSVEAMLAVPTGLVRVAVTRQTFESLVEPYLAETVEVLGRAVADAESSAKVASIYVVGGASRSPIVERLLRQAFPAVQVIRRGDPKASIALGAVSLELPGTASLGPSPVPAAPVHVVPEPVAATDGTAPILTSCTRSRQ